MQEDKGMIEDEMVGWYHQLNGHEFEQAPGVGDGQGGLVCYSPWGRKESDTTEQLHFTSLASYICFFSCPFFPDPMQSFLMYMCVGANFSYDSINTG